MIPFMGFSFLTLASLLSILACYTCFVGNTQASEILLKRISVLQLGLMLGAFFVLMYLCGSLDFSVLYVVMHTHTALPIQYRLAATWGGHEGSLLLWLSLLALWTFLFSRTESVPQKFKVDALWVLQWIFLLFGLFVIFTSNPFARVLPLSPMEGKDLNPLLQDPGLIFHPPLLYIGYVGAAIPYSFTFSALKNKTWTPETAKALRPWVLWAWAFLTAGITLGSFWAYYELGWGGFWFWDPVENASVMPWFCLTALVHSLIVSEKRAMLKRLCLLLGLFAFLFSVLGTFLVRSGVLVSVHAFANDPARGQMILLMLFVFSLASLILYLWRVPQIKEAAVQNYASKEGLMAIGTLVFFTIAMIVVLGTLYPIILEMGFNEKISVGAPYFNAMILPLGLVVLVLASLAPTVTWLKFTAPVKRHFICIDIAIACTVLLAFCMNQWSFYFLTGICASIWLIEITLYRIIERLKTGKAFSLPFFGMILGHVGIAVLALGLSLTTTLSVVRELNLSFGETVTLSGVQFTLQSVESMSGANYTSQKGTVAVLDKGNTFLMFPEKRVFVSGTQAYTEMALDAGLRRDILIALGESLDKNHWSVRLQVRPYVRLIWLGGILMALAGVLSGLSSRYRKSETVK